MGDRKYSESGQSGRDGIVVSIGLLLVFAQLIVVPFNYAQTRNPRRVDEAGRKAPTEKADPIEQAVKTICEQRKRDPRGSLSIDEMARIRPLPLTDRRVVA